MKILDLFSCAGLAADGYAAAGFDVTCVDADHRPLRHNPHTTFIGEHLAAAVMQRSVAA